MTNKRRLAAFLLTMISASSMPAFGQTADLLECRRIDNPLERVACYDEFVDGRQTTEHAPAVRTTPVEPATQAPVQPQPVSPEEAFGRSDREVRQAAKIERVEEIVGRISVLRETPLGQHVVTLDNGQVWAQQDNRRLVLREGDQVTISEGLGGSYYLNKKEGSRSLRVRRVD